MTDEEAATIGRRDRRALIQYGAIFFLLEKLLETRNAPGAFYSVAAKPKAE